MDFKVHGINHIGLAPKDAAQARKFFQEILGLAHLGDELVAAQKTNTMMFTSNNHTGGPRQERLEILEPHDSSGPIQKFLETRGSGIHHLALSVDNVAAAITHLVEHGVQMIDKSPREGAHNTRIAFVHPKSTGGLLVELVEESH